MRMFIVIIMVLIFPSAARALTVDLAQESVDITTGFNGAELVLFGVKDGAGDIAVVVRGPRKTMVVRRKEKVILTWMNRVSMTFRDVPVYYDYAVSGKLENLATPDVLKENGIGPEALYFQPGGRKRGDKTVEEFQKALIRNKQEEGLFPREGKDIVFLNDNFFRTTLYVPSNVPTGDYQIETFLIRGGRVRALSTTNLRVGQVGTSASIYAFAHRHAIAYGLVCVFIAAFAGWAANAVRQSG